MYEIEQALNQVIDQCIDWKFKLIKIKITFSMLIEYVWQSTYGGFRKTTHGQFVKYIYSPFFANQERNIPFTFQLLKRESETKGYLDYIHREIQKKLNLRQKPVIQDILLFLQYHFVYFLYQM
jgi:predicted GTPase